MPEDLAGQGDASRPRAPRAGGKFRGKPGAKGKVDFKNRPRPGAGGPTRLRSGGGKKRRK